jgi:diketogulonate reductase-like aldo/keto reductase
MFLSCSHLMWSHSHVVLSGLSFSVNSVPKPRMLSVRAVYVLGSLQLGIGLVPFCPLGRGFLTGEVKRAEEYPEGDFRRTDPRYQGENYDANMKAARMVRDIAAVKHAKPGQIALAWLLNKGEDIVPIPGTKRRKYLEENVAAETVQLDPAQMKVLDDALAPGKVSGKRYADWIMATIDR